MVDQMRGDCAGFAGHPVVRTPNLDRLAGRSAVFENTYVKSPLCGPSRTCLFTSRYVHEHGVWWNGIPFRGHCELLPEVLGETGYETAIVGKLHFAPADRSHGFDHKELHEELLLDGTGLEAYEQFLAAQSPPAKGPYDSTVWTHRPRRTGICEMDESLEETRWVADRTCEFFHRHRGKADAPFFLFASFIRPHSPYTPLPRFAKMYEHASIRAPEFEASEWEQVPPRIGAYAKSWGWDRLTGQDAVEVRRHYYGLCSQIDDGVGRILAGLEESGLADRTIVVFTSDHGDFLGEHGLYLKEHLYEGSVHVPLVIHDPRQCDGPVRCAALVESIDIMPTLLELTDVPAPASLRGRSLVPLMSDPTRPHREAVFMEWRTHSVLDDVRDVMDTCVDPNLKAIRTNEWKYIHYTGEPGELYNLREDPFERNNLFGDIGSRQARDGLRERLLAWAPAQERQAAPEPDNPYFASLFK
jgi:choline-sulfatase